MILPVTGSVSVLRDRLLLCEETAADPARSGCRSPFLRELLRIAAASEADRINRELRRRAGRARRRREVIP